MRDSTVFADSFLDGFTMAGFLNRLHQPGGATCLSAPAPERTQTDGEPIIPVQGAVKGAGITRDEDTH